MDYTTCPLCKCPVVIGRREDGSADHYEFIDIAGRQHIPNPIPPVLADFLRASRRGKKTVAIVGGAWSSGPWAPWGETDVWSLNDHHARPWYKVEGVTRWFQIHPKEVFTTERISKHWEWLQKEHPFPIYMQRVYDDVPNSIKYPLREIQNELIGNLYRGEEKIEKIFTSTVCYEMALALYEGFERIELYGVELLSEGEYSYQREAMTFWMGKADGMGVEVWMPETCALLVTPLYAYEQIRTGDGAIVWEK
jgi:hypothetical protein